MRFPIAGGQRKAIMSRIKRMASMQSMSFKRRRRAAMVRVLAMMRIPAIMRQAMMMTLAIMEREAALGLKKEAQRA